MVGVGEAHTVTISDTAKIYTWGWNDDFQLGRETRSYKHEKPTEVSIEGLKPKSLAVGDRHNLMLDYFGNLYVWGANDKGQLGMGHTHEMREIAIIKFLSNEEHIYQINARGNNSLVVTDTGRAFYWPYTAANGEITPSPVELSIPDKYRVISASCGINFAMLLTNGGYLFAFGHDNSEGQLGLGDDIPRDTPVMIERLVEVIMNYHI
jgi:Alpha-tubulin suppressor and related RCC1 domain-containing proteins